MDAREIAGLESELVKFLSECDDCFGRSEPRETELTKSYPLHLVCSWIGNSQLIAAKHYLQVTDDDFTRAAEVPAEADATTTGTDNGLRS
jgi:hypothetical protein